MTFEFDLGKKFDFRLPQKACTIYVLRCDSTNVYLRYTTPREPRGKEFALYRASAIRTPSDTEEVRVINPVPSNGKLELEVVTEPTVTPIPTTRAPVGGTVATGVVEVGEEPVRLPAAKVMEGREVVIRADTENTATIYVNGFPLLAGEAVMLQLADLGDIELVAGAAGQKAYYLAEVRA